MKSYICTWDVLIVVLQLFTKTYTIEELTHFFLKSLGYLSDFMLTLRVRFISKTPSSHKIDARGGQKKKNDIDIEKRSLLMKVCKVLPDTIT